MSLIERAGAAALPLLRRLDAETAHRLTIGALALVPASALPAPAADDPRLAVEAFGLRFPNPVGLAAGFDKNAEAVDALLSLGFGFVEAGTATPLPQPGNPRPRLFRLPKDEAVINRFGFNGEGAARVRARLAARSRTARGVVGVNIGANKDAADRAADYARGVEELAAFADYLTVNVSSPNTPGLRDLQQADALDDLLARVLEARAHVAGRKPVLLKIAPDLSLSELDAIVACARRREVDGLIVSNTTLSRPAALRERELAREAGGLSGRPLFDLSTRMLAQAFLRAEGAFPLVGAGGIDGPERAFAKIEAGASLVQLYSALVFKGPGLPRRIVRGLSRILDERGLARIEGAVGSRAQDFAEGKAHGL